MDKLLHQNSSIAPPLLPHSFDMARVIANVNSFLNPLREDYILGHHVSKIQDGYAYISFAVPVKMLQAFHLIFQSMAQLCQIVDVKVRSKSAQNREVSIDEIEKRKKAQDNFKQKVLSAYDKYISKGCSVNEAISLTNREIKRNSTFSSYEIIKDVLRAAGKFRTKYKKSTEITC